MSDLAMAVAKAIDVWHAEHPGLTVNEILAAIESIRHELTEALLR